MNNRYIRSKFVSCRLLIIISTFLLFLLSCSEIEDLKIETLTIEEKNACESGFLKIQKKLNLARDYHGGLAVVRYKQEVDPGLGQVVYLRP